MRYLLDVNALVALGFLQHEFHERVAAWVRASVVKGSVEMATCSITELGFVRVLVQAPQYGFAVSQARDLLLRLKAARVLKLFLTITTSRACRLGSRQQNKRPMAISHNWPEQRVQFLQLWTGGSPVHFKYQQVNESSGRHQQRHRAELASFRIRMWAAIRWMLPPFQDSSVPSGLHAF